MDVRYCRSCNARIIWAWTEAGQRTPVNAAPIDYDGSGQGVYVLVKRLPEPHLSDAPLVIEANDRLASAGAAIYLTHWATCPNAQQHRRPPATQDGRPDPERPEGSAAEAAQGGETPRARLSPPAPSGRTTWLVLEADGTDAMRSVAAAGATVEHSGGQLSVYVASTDPLIVHRIERAANRNGVRLLREAS